MFFLLAALAKGIEIAFGSTICPCQKYQLFCTPGCPCDTNCPNSNQAAANPRYLYRKDMLPKCPESRFAQVSGSLGQWLLREFFCISTDNRPIPNPQKYSDTVNPEALNATIETPAEALYGGKIIIFSSTNPTLNQTEFSLPEQGITSTCANSPVKFMLPIESQTCRTPPHTWPGINGPVIDYMIAGNYNFTINPIGIDTTLPLTNSYVYTFVLFTQTPESSILRITNGSNIVAGEAYVSVSFLTFPNNETFQNTYLNVTNVQNSGLLPVRSGKWGYSLGAPVIAFYDDPDNPGDVIFDDIYQPYMRIPFGTDCSTLKNTYLKFGVDTVSGCKMPNPPAPLNTLSYIPKGIAAIGNPTLDLNDTTIWINPNSQNLCDASSGKSINMIINYQRMGTVDDFQYRIVTITTSCFDLVDPNDFIFSVSFQLEQTDVQMFVPRKPDALPALKPGVFYPFSAGTISRPSAFLLTFMAFVSTMTFVFL